MTIFHDLATLIFGPKKTRDTTKTIPKPGPINTVNVGAYGGPAFVDDQRQAPVPWIGNPWSPQIGTDGEINTFDQQYADMSHGGQSDDYYRLHGQARADNLRNTRTQETITTDFPNLPVPHVHLPPVVARSVPIERWTAYGHKELGSYTRPFDQTIRHRLTGDHFSMADHRRNYPIFQMAPVNQRRNTFRLEPAQWDANIVDVVDTNPPETSGYSSSPQQNAPNNRSYRLV
jgi:hypothetical protein